MRENIKSAALRLFLKFGPKRTTIDDITLELQTSKKVFYEYFTNKEELIKEIFDEVMEDTKNYLEDISNNHQDQLMCLLLWQFSFYSYLRKYSSSCIYELNKYYQDIVSDYRLFREDVVLKNLLCQANDAKEQGILRSDINLKVFIETQLYSLEGLILGNFNVVSEEEQLDYANHIIINNIRGAVSENCIMHFESCLSKIRKL